MQNTDPTAITWMIPTTVEHSTIMKRKSSKKKKKKKEKTSTHPYEIFIMENINLPLFPIDIWIEITSYLGLNHLIPLLLTNRTLSKLICGDDRIWKQQCLYLCPALTHRFGDASTISELESPSYKEQILKKRYLDTRKKDNWRSVVRTLVKKCCKECGADPNLDKTANINFFYENFIANWRLCKFCLRHEPKYSLITKTDAKSTYCVKDEDLNELELLDRVIKKRNPYYRSAAPMRLYLRSDIEQLSQRKKKEKEEQKVKDREQKIRKAMLEYRGKSEQIQQEIDDEIMKEREKKTGPIYEYLTGSNTSTPKSIVTTFYRDMGIEDRKKRKRSVNKVASKRSRKSQVEEIEQDDATVEKVEHLTPRLTSRQQSMRDTKEKQLCAELAKHNVKDIENLIDDMKRTQRGLLYDFYSGAVAGSVGSTVAKFLKSEEKM